MVNVRTCINVYSEMNPWIDFCIVLTDEKDIPDAKEIIEQAYDSWFSAKNQTDEPIMEYISRRLTEVCIEHEIYFTGKEEEDYEWFNTIIQNRTES